MTEKYEFIETLRLDNTVDGLAKYAYPLSKMCQWLEVSRSGFSHWRDRPTSATRKRREHLKQLVQAHFDLSRGTYGYRRVHAALLRQGEQIGPELVRDLMRELGLASCQPRPYRATTQPDSAGAEGIEDLVGRDFTAERPGTKLIGDITYIRTWEGWLYLATVIDCYSKAVVGWSMATHMKTSLIRDALGNATATITIEKDAIFHSDRGCQYSSTAYQEQLKEFGLRSSMGRTGICWDNAMAESFFATLKNELVHRTAYPTRKHARRDIARYIEGFYNRQRLHSGLGYKTPHEVHNEYLNRQNAA